MQCTKNKCLGNLEKNGVLHCCKCGQEYSDIILSSLKTLTNYYKSKKEGVDPVIIETGRKTLLELKKLNLAFCTSKGWFPSTKGQEFLRQYAEENK